MTIEELLEALPSEINIDGNSYILFIDKRGDKSWVVAYSERKLDFSDHRGPLRDSLEAVYQDLKDNNLL